MKLVVVIVVIASCFALSGCERQEAKTAVKSLLNDPDSAQFSSLVDGAADGNVCGYVNAKNRIGGYVGRQPFFYEKSSTTTAIVPEVKDSDFRRLYDEIDLKWDFSQSLSNVTTRCELAARWQQVCGFPYPGRTSRFCADVNDGARLYEALRSAYGR